MKGIDAKPADFEFSLWSPACQQLDVFEQTIQYVRDGQSARFRKWRRMASGMAPTLLFLHGLGSSFDDFRAIWSDGRFAGFGIVGVEFPGHGRSISPSGHLVRADDLAEIALLAANAPDVQPLVVIGHSLGGLVGLLAHDKGLPAAAFVNIEGNLTGEDCGYVSRRSAGVSYLCFRDEVLPGLRAACSRSRREGDRNYAQSLAFIDSRQYHAYCTDIVELSDSGALLDSFINFPGPKLHLRGADARPPSYIDRLEGCSCVEIADAGHFAFIDNRAAVNGAIYRFLHDSNLVGDPA